MKLNVMEQSYFTKGGKSFMVRQAQEVMDYARTLFATTDNALTTLEEYTITLEEEKAWIRHALNHPTTLILVAEMDGRIIGFLDFAAKPKKKAAHSGEFGISVHSDFRGMGIGRSLIESLMRWAQANEHIEKVILQVFHTNSMAISLYKSLGFTEEGRFVRAVKQPSGKYVDIIQMYRKC